MNETKGIGSVLQRLSEMLKSPEPIKFEPEKPKLPSVTNTRVLPGLNPSREFRQRLFGLDESHDQSVSALMEWGEWFFRRAANNDRSQGYTLVLTGGTGTAKTHIATALYKQLSVWGVEMSFTPYPDDPPSIRGWRGKFPSALMIDWPLIAEADKEMNFERFLEEIEEAQIVIIDDVGSESDRFKSGEAAARLRRVLSVCERKWLLVTTNLSREQIADSYDARVADRLSAARWFDLGDAPSYRPKLAEGKRL